MRAIGLSATVAEPESLARFLVPQRDGKEVSADIVVAGGAAAPVVEMLDTKERLPWAGHTARHALGEMYDLIKRNKTTLIFVNTRSQAEMLFQDFWRMNDDGLAIALHHGSLDVAQRRKVEDAMAAGKLRGVVCTSSLDLGIDWGDIDLVINVGAPKGSSRLMQRIGRANHRLDEPSRAVLDSRQSLRGAGMPRRDRCDRGECAGHAAACAPAGSTCWRSTCSAAPAASRFFPTNSMRKC